MPDGALVAKRDAPVGGQAVLEGVMMRGVSTWAVAVRKPAPDQGPDEKIPTGEIAITSEPLVSWVKKHRAYRLPVIRGVVALLKVGHAPTNLRLPGRVPRKADTEDGKDIAHKR